MPAAKAVGILARDPGELFLVLDADDAPHTAECRTAHDPPPATTEVDDHVVLAESQGVEDGEDDVE